MVEHKRPPCPIRTQLPKLFDQYKLLSRPLGTREADDAWVDNFSRTIYAAKREAAADAVAAALAEGISPGVDRRSDFAGRQSAVAARSRSPPAAERRQADRQRAWRFGRRSRFGFGQCLARISPASATRAM